MVCMVFLFRWYKKMTLLAWQGCEWIDFNLPVPWSISFETFWEWCDDGDRWFMVDGWLCTILVVKPSPHRWGHVSSSEAALLVRGSPEIENFSSLMCHWVWTNLRPEVEIQQLRFQSMRSLELVDFRINGKSLKVRLLKMIPSQNSRRD